MLYTRPVYRIARGFTVDKHQEDRTQTGPSWNDVQEHLRELGKTHHRACRVELNLLPDTAGRTTFGLWVRVVAWERSEGRLLGERAKGGRWPTSEHKTMPGMLLKLIHQLDFELTERKEKAERQAAF